MTRTWKQRVGTTAAAVLAGVFIMALAASPTFADNDNDDHTNFCKGLKGEAHEICHEACDEKRCHQRDLPGCPKYRERFRKETGTSILPCDTQPTATPQPPGTTATPGATSTSVAGATATVIPPTATPGGPQRNALFTQTVIGHYPLGEGDNGQATVNVSDPSSVVVMPFDVTTNRGSFEIVSRIGVIGDPAIDFAPIVTHWDYWDENGDHLADVFICLGSNDTVVVDPSNLQGQIRVPGNRLPIGPIINLTGRRGVVFVTAYENASPFVCEALDPTSPLDMQLVGSWTILNLNTNVSFGGNAIGSPLLPDPGLLDPNNDPNSGFGGTPSIVLQTFNPMILSDSEVILFGVQETGGNGNFQEGVGPIREPIPGRTGHVCCSTEFIDNLGIRISLPDVCFNAASFLPISAEAAEPGETPIIPPVATVNSSGLLRFEFCEVHGTDGTTGLPTTVVLPEATDRDGNSVMEFIYGFHGQAIGG